MELAIRKFTTFAIPGTTHLFSKAIGFKIPSGYELEIGTLLPELARSAFAMRITDLLCFYGTEDGTSTISVSSALSVGVPGREKSKTRVHHTLHRVTATKRMFS